MTADDEEAKKELDAVKQLLDGLLGEAKRALLTIIQIVENIVVKDDPKFRCIKQDSPYSDTSN